MINVLRDPLWQFVGVLLALLSVAAAFWIYWLQRQTKELAFGLVSSRRLLSVSDELSSRVSILLDGKTVKDVHLVVYGLKNSGHSAICASDFERALKINFNEGQVISAEIASQSPPNLGASLSSSDTGVELRPLLLNAGDQLLIQVLLSAPYPREDIDTRIVGISSLAKINSIPLLPPFFESGLPLAIIVWLLSGMFSFFVSPDKTLAIGFFCLAVFAMMYSIAKRLFEGFGSAARRRISDAGI
jgi:hypothetical protein